MTILLNEIKHMLSDVKCTAFDQRQKNICNNDTVIVLEGPLKVWHFLEIIYHIY